MNIEQLRARLVELNETGKAIQAKADAEKRELTPEEQTEIDAVFAEFEQVENDIKRRERLAAQDDRLGETRGRVVPPLASAATEVVVQNRGMERTVLRTQEERARWGFRDFGEFCNSVRNAAVNPSGMDQRLIQNALTTYGAEGVGA